MFWSPAQRCLGRRVDDLLPSRPLHRARVTGVGAGLCRTVDVGQTRKRRRRRRHPPAEVGTRRFRAQGRRAWKAGTAVPECLRRRARQAQRETGRAARLVPRGFPRDSRRGAVRTLRPSPEGRLGGGVGRRQRTVRRLTHGMCRPSGTNRYYDILPALSADIRGQHQTHVNRSMTALLNLSLISPSKMPEPMRSRMSSVGTALKLATSSLR